MGGLGQSFYDFISKRIIQIQAVIIYQQFHKKTAALQEHVFEHVGKYAWSDQIGTITCFTVTFCRLVLSADDLCKQLRPRSGPTECLA